MSIATTPGAVVFHTETTISSATRRPPSTSFTGTAIRHRCRRDSTRTSFDLIKLNPFRNPGALTISGTPIDVGKLQLDAYVVAGVTDHITPWKSVYQTASILGKETTFILSNAGHLQSLLNPPGNPKATFVTGAASSPDPEAFATGAAKESGSWWTHWSQWLSTRSGDRVQAPPFLGNAEFPPGQAAPGTYVFNA